MPGRPLNERLPTLNIDNRCFQRPLPNIGINCQRTFVLCVWQRIWLFPFFVAWQMRQGKSQKRINGAKKRKRILPKKGHEDQLFLSNFSDKPILLRTSLFLH